MKTEEYCYFCGEKATSKEHLPPKQFFKGFTVDKLTVPSCEKHNTDKGGDDEAIVKAMLLSLERNNLVLNNDIKLALDKVRPHYKQVKKKVTEKAIYKHNDNHFEFVVLEKNVDLADWIIKLSAGLIWYKTKDFDSNNKFAKAYVFERNSYPVYEIPADISSYKEEYDRKMKLIKLLDEIEWIKGWNDKKIKYPETIFKYFYKIINKNIYIKYIFYQQFTFYIEIELSDKTIKKIE